MSSDSSRQISRPVHGLIKKNPVAETRGAPYSTRRCPLLVQPNHLSGFKRLALNHVAAAHGTDFESDIDLASRLRTLVRKPYHSLGADGTLKGSFIGPIKHRTTADSRCLVRSSRSPGRSGKCWPCGRFSKAVILCGKVCRT